MPSLPHEVIKFIPPPPSPSLDGIYRLTLLLRCGPRQGKQSARKETEKKREHPRGHLEGTNIRNAERTHYGKGKSLYSAAALFINLEPGIEMACQRGQSMGRRDVLRSRV